MKNNSQNEKLRVCYSLDDYLNNPAGYDLLKLSEEVVLRIKAEKESISGVEKANANVNAADKNVTNALTIAALRGQTEIVKDLVRECNADVNAANDEGNTALMAAAEGGNTEIVKILESAIEANKFSNDIEHKVDNSTDSDVFISVYKNKILEKGFKNELSKRIKSAGNELTIPEEILDKIKSLFTEAQDNLLFKCSELFYLITEEKVSPAPLDKLILQSQKGSFVSECTEQTRNLISFYTERGVKSSINIEDLLLGKIKIENEDIESLQQEIYLANIKILQDNIGEFIISSNEVYEVIQNLIKTTILPSSLRDSLGNVIEVYEDFQANPLSCAMHNKICAMQDTINTLVENTKHADDIEDMELALAPIFKATNMYPFAEEESVASLIGVNEVNNESSDM